MKKCSKCGEVKPLVAFCKDATRLDGLTSQCKACRADYRAANRDNHNKQKRHRRTANLDKMREIGRARIKNATETLSDSYIKQRLIRNTTLRPCDIPDWLVEAKREQLRLKRELRK